MSDIRRAEMGDDTRQPQENARAFTSESLDLRSNESIRAMTTARSSEMADSFLPPLTLELETGEKSGDADGDIPGCGGEDATPESKDDLSNAVDALNKSGFRSDKDADGNIHVKSPAGKDMLITAGSPITVGENGDITVLHQGSKSYFVTFKSNGSYEALSEQADGSSVKSTFRADGSSSRESNGAVSEFDKDMNQTSSRALTAGVPEERR